MSVTPKNERANNELLHPCPLFSVVTVYATLGDEALIHGINETDVRFIITDASLLHKLSALIDRLPKVEHIVYLGNVVKKSALLGFSRRVKVHSMHEVEEIGESQDDSKYETFDSKKLHVYHMYAICTATIALVMVINSLFINASTHKLMV